MHALELTLVLLGASIAMVAIVRRFGMPTLVGYLAVGVVLGPYAGNLAGDSDVVHTLARVRRRLPDVHARAGVQPAQAGEPAQLRVRARAGAGRRHDRPGDAGGVRVSAGLGRPVGAGRPRLARGDRDRRRAGDVLDGAGEQDADREPRTRNRARRRVVRHPAVPGPGADPAADPDAGAGREGVGIVVAADLRLGRGQGGAAAVPAAAVRSAVDARLVPACRTAAVARGVHAERPAGHAAVRLADRARRACRWSWARSWPGC